MRPLNNYYWFKQGISGESFTKLNQLKDSLEFKSGQVKTQNDGLKLNSDYRRSEIAWVNKTNENQWLYKLLYDHAVTANTNMWQFYHDPLASCSEKIQFTRYLESESGHYDWHMDIGDGDIQSKRKISIVVQLTDPSEYEGGDLQLMTRKKIITLPKQMGAVFIFPPYFMHRVTNVTKGLRESLVFWISGPEFR